MLKRVAAVAGTVLVSGSLAAWALWPAATPAPTPSLSNPPLTSTAPVPVTPDFASMPEGLRPKLGSVAKFDFGAKSKNRVSGIQWLTDANTLEKATLRQNQRQSLKGLQQAFSRRVSHRSRGVPDGQPAQRGLDCGQAPADPKLQPRQPPQPDGQQADQPGGMVVPLPIHRGQRQGVAFQAAHRLLDQRLVAVRQDGLL